MIGDFFGATHDFEYNIGDKLLKHIILKYLELTYYLNLKLAFLLKIQNTMRKNFMRKYKKILIQ